VWLLLPEQEKKAKEKKHEKRKSGYLSDAAHLLT
jgi:hypothetical protein